MHITKTSAPFESLFFWCVRRNRTVRKVHETKMREEKRMRHNEILLGYWICAWHKNLKGAERIFFRFVRSFFCYPLNVTINFDDEMLFDSYQVIIGRCWCCCCYCIALFYMLLYMQMQIIYR